jgi:hypothetical protein
MAGEAQTAAGWLPVSLPIAAAIMLAAPAAPWAIALDESRSADAAWA